MFTLRYRINDGFVEEIEEHDGEWGLENIFEGTEYKTVKNLPEYNKYRQFLRVVNDNIIIENKQLEEEQLAEIEWLERHEELSKLKIWFDYYYSQHEQKYRRFIALNKLTDDNKDPNNELVALYNLAEQKRQRIQELESLV